MLLQMLLGTVPVSSGHAKALQLKDNAVNDSMEERQHDVNLHTRAPVNALEERSRTLRLNTNSTCMNNY